MFRIPASRGGAFAASMANANKKKPPDYVPPPVDRQAQNLAAIEAAKAKRAEKNQKRLKQNIERHVEPLDHLFSTSSAPRIDMLTGEVE